MNNDHLNALRVKLSNERSRLSQSKNANEKLMRQVWISQLEREIRSEKQFLQIPEVSDEELLSELRS